MNCTNRSQVDQPLGDGATITALGYEIVLRRRAVGTLELPTGRLVACDPLDHPDTEPFAYKVTPGSYPVKLVVDGAADRQHVRQEPFGTVARDQIGGERLDPMRLSDFSLTTREGRQIPLDQIGRSEIRAMTSASQACGSTPFNLQVSIRV